MVYPGAQVLELLSAPFPKGGGGVTNHPSFLPGQVGKKNDS